ncbi:30S ribosome-binding factor RbfA [Fodinicurvata sp. EGI_FJ10296]|uniref:30S ribosome-binding factor RbfA n=1 Tax=Fodinicurvata sp. EGI_FJ10296 TaxID=3231908 RepID=UPI003451D87D
MPARKRQGRTEPTQRQLRVGEEVRHTLSAILNRNDIHDPDLDGISVTVSEVRMGPNLRSAHVFIMPLAGENRDTVLAALSRATPFLRGQIGRQVRLKFTPTLRFEIDTRFDDADRMDNLLRSLEPNVERTLADVAFGDDGIEGGIEGGNEDADGDDETVPRKDEPGREDS